jgi:hypothetical protein
LRRNDDAMKTGGGIEEEVTEVEYIIARFLG